MGYDKWQDETVQEVNWYTKSTAGSSDLPDIGVVAFFKRFFKWIGRGLKKVGKAIWGGLKKIGKVLKKVLPIALLAASAFFTFGGALGITAGWATKIGGFVSKLGITGKLGNVLSGAIVHAGRGALIGGITGGATGQGFMKGATAGAAIGAITGGVTGFMKAPVTAGAQAAKGGVQESKALMGAGNVPEKW